jgi:hypothetical protein
LELTRYFWKLLNSMAFANVSISSRTAGPPEAAPSRAGAAEVEAAAAVEAVPAEVAAEGQSREELEVAEVLSQLGKLTEVD